MSDLLKLAAQLRARSDDDLSALVKQRQVGTQNLRDFFDLGEQLLSTRNLQATIASLSLSKLTALDAIGRDTAATSLEDLRTLEALALAYQDGDTWRTFENVTEVLAGLRDAKDKPKQKPSLVILAERASDFSLTAATTRSNLTQDDLDRDCGIALFESMQALTELVFFVEQHFVREVGRGNVGLPDLKRLAARVSKSTDYAREIFDLAATARLTTLVDGRWQLGSVADAWITATPVERWQLLAEAWRAAIGEVGCGELLAALPSDTPAVVSLADLLSSLYPLADSYMAGNIRKTIDRGNLIGLTHDGFTASWTRAVLAGEIAYCSQQIAPRIPATSDRLIVQADLSLIAPGPLSTRTELKIREFADCESIGFASTYRISALSITLGLERGLRIDEIRDVLVALSDKALPQPVEYLLRESEERFGRLVVHSASMNDHSVLTSSDPILLQAILNDPAMKPFGLVLTSDQNLACKFEPDVLYFGLREAGYAAIRDDALRATAAPVAHALLETSSVNPSVSAEEALLGDIARIREQDSRPGISPDSDDVTRQIQLAIKNRVKLNITVRTEAGATHEFLLEPTGIANGRLRAKDRKADIERTLPLSSISSVTLA